MSSASSDAAEDVPRNNSARKLLDGLLADKCSQHFKVLPDPILYSQYYNVITRPISLADVSMCINGPARYSLTDVTRDLRRMISNAKRYNVAESQVFQDALVMEVRRQRLRGCHSGVAVRLALSLTVVALSAQSWERIVWLLTSDRSGFLWCFPQRVIRRLVKEIEADKDGDSDEDAW